MAVVKVLVLLSTVIGHCTSLTIVETAAGNADFSVLVEAVTAADLGATLGDTGPFTVFAPTNAAFTAALTDLGITKAELLARSDLADILKYHVLSGKTVSTALAASQTPTTLHSQGLKVIVTKNAGTVTFGGATVTSADIDCSNGVIHAIDKVVLPPSMNIVETAQANPAFSVLVEALTAANLVTALTGSGPFTVFAPTDTAFTTALTDLGITKAELLARSDLADILKYHVIGASFPSMDLDATQSPATLQGATVVVTKDGANVVFGGASVTAADLHCSNGVIHTIDKVVMPPAAAVSGAGAKFGSLFLATGVAAVLAMA
jgi:uncharacterized surface protein with fasciclin (FAS1) repeats